MLQTVSNISRNIARNIEIGSEEPVVRSGLYHLIQTNHKHLIIMTEAEGLRTVTSDLNSGVPTPVLK